MRADARVTREEVCDGILSRTNYDLGVPESAVDSRTANHRPTVGGVTMNQELARVLREVANQIEQGFSTGQVSDTCLWGFTVTNVRVEIELLSEEQPEKE